MYVEGQFAVAVIENSTFTNVQARYGAGASAINGGTLQISDTYFSNAVAAEEGGAVNGYLDAKITLSSVTMDSCSAAVRAIRLLWLS